MPMSPHSIPVELMEILNRINDNIQEVKERLARLEAQDHSESIRILRAEVDKERNERISIQIELANVKTKLAPLVIGISMAGAVIIETVVKTLHF